MSNYFGEKMSLWTPLVGFDMTKPDLGVDEYIETIGFIPNAISLFVFNADIINLHEKGMKEEITFPIDYCNYYGKKENEIRQIQPWTNYKLKQLCLNLKEKGIKVYFGIMGLHTTPEDAKKFGGNFGYISQQQFLIKHEEICTEGTSWTGHTCILKRMSNGMLFEDYFSQKVDETLEDYCADGVHLGDGFFPPCMQLDRGDYSFDLIRQFDDRFPNILPKELVENTNGLYSDINKRVQLIWGNYKQEWINFLSQRYNEFFAKLAKVLHPKNRRIMVCNAWTSEPFEAYYRFGIDYKGISEAGVDEICVEDQATIAYATGPSDMRLKNYEYYITPMVTKAYAPKTKYLGINFVKDSTEEASMVGVLPSACEREIFSLMEHYNITPNDKEKALDGFFICLADSVKKEEWKWLNKRYETVFCTKVEKTLGVTAVIADDYVKGFLPEYIVSRRWSSHKFIAGINRYAGGINCSVNINDLSNVEGDLLVPNADLLTDTQLNEILNYKKGIVVITTVNCKKDKFNNTGYSFSFSDNGVTNEKYKSVALVYNLDTNTNIETIIEDENIEKCIDYSEEDLSKVKDTWIWMDDIIFRKVTSGFLKMIANIFLQNRDIIRVEPNSEYFVSKLTNGAYRVVIPNIKSDQYKTVSVYFEGQLVDVENKLDFPSDKPKLILEDGRVVSQQSMAKNFTNAKGIVVRILPYGVAVVDLYLKCLN